LHVESIDETPAAKTPDIRIDGFIFPAVAECKRQMESR